MAKFFNYRNIDFKLNEEDFHATQVSLSVQASVEPVILSDGSLLNYAPQGALVGSLTCDFYLTGSLPSFLDITGTNESAIPVTFANVSITGVYAKSISFNVEPFQPIVVTAGFDWYGNVDLQDFKEQSARTRTYKDKPQYIANAYKSYLSTDNIFQDGDSLGNVVSFSYNASCDRPAFYNVDEVFPFRVAKLNKNCQLQLSSNSLGESISVDGKTAVCTIYLKDFYGQALQQFDVSGILTNQNYQISEGNYMLTDATIEQTVTETKTLV
jgi:hypothetical protein